MVVSWVACCSGRSLEKPTMSSRNTARCSVRVTTKGTMASSIAAVESWSGPSPTGSGSRISIGWLPTAAAIS